MENVTIGQRLRFVSAKGYTSPDGEPCTVYGINPISRRAAVNVAGDEQSPAGYSYSVSFDELHPLQSESA